MSKRNSTTLKDENRSQRDSAKSTQSQSLFHEHSKNLPEHFAENILFLEMEVETNKVTIENVNQLIELYRIGVEYFESIKSDKFLIFKNKTQQLLLKQCVNQCMNDAYQQQVSTPKVIHQGKKLDLELQMQYVRQDNQHDKVSQLIESHGQQSLRVNRLINLYYLIIQQEILKIKMNKSQKDQREGDNNLLGLQDKKTDIYQFLNNFYMQSVLFTQEELNQLEPHPFDYVQQKSKYLENLCTYQPINQQIPSLQIAKQKYGNLANQLKNKQLEDQKLLKPDSFNTIFQEEKPIDNTAIKQQYLEDFVLKPQEEQKQTKMNQYIQLCGIVQSQEPTKEEKQAKLVDLQILRREIDMIQQKAKKLFVSEREMCKNVNMLNKLSTSLLSMYNIYFPEIFDALIDDLLLDEIVHLNNVEEKIVSPQKEDKEIPIITDNEDLQLVIEKLALLIDDQ